MILQYEKFVNEFEYHLFKNGNSAHTIRAYLSDAKQFLEMVGAVGATTCEDRAALYINEVRKTMSPATVRRKKASIRLFCAVTWNIEVLGSYRTPTPAAGQAHPLPHAGADLRAILHAARDRHQPLIALCGFAGLRVSEALNVRDRDITSDYDGQHWVRVYGKGSKVRDVPIVDEAIPWLHLRDRQSPDRLLAPFSDRAARRAITTAAQRAGITRPVSSHDLRHTFGSEAYRTSKDLRAVQELLGHSSPITTGGYTGISQTTKTNTVKGAFA